MNTLELLKASATTALLSAACHAQAPGTAPAAPPADSAPAAPAVHPDNLPPAPHLDNGETLWPQEAMDDGTLYVMYAPQLESLVGSSASARAAISLTPAGAEPVFGTVALTARVDDDTAAGLIELSGITVGKVALADGKDTAGLAATLQRMLKGMHFTLQRSAALATMEWDAPRAGGRPSVSSATPAIETVDHAAVLLQLDGPPVLRLVKAGIGIAQNTPSLLAFDTGSNRWLTRIGQDSWMSAAKYAGPYARCDPPSAGIIKAIEDVLPARHPDAGGTPLSAPAQLPEVVVRTVPTCLVSVDGAPKLTMVADGLFAVANANCDLFNSTDSGPWWILASGRWFSAPDLVSGPWTFVAPSKLPASFAQIDPRGTWGNVLASVPGTEAAKDATYQQAIVHTGTLDRSKAAASVRYAGGAPRMQDIAGTPLSWAANANVPVIRCDGTFYACEEAAWFTAPSATGPWSLCDALPAAIGSIPPTCPVYPVTFVRVETSTATTVTFSYTAGYMNSFVGPDGGIVYGSGTATPGTTVATVGPPVPDEGVTWGDYMGWPATYGYWPSFGYAGWTCGSYPGWVDFGLQCGPAWAAPGWWGPGDSFGVGYALGVDYAGAWQWGYHPWGSGGHDGWWSSHWGGAYGRGWSGAATGGNRAAGGGTSETVSSRWEHAGGLSNDVSASGDGRVMQHRSGTDYVRGADGWHQAPAAGTKTPAKPATGSGGFREATDAPSAVNAARSNTSMDDFRPDPNHNFDGSPRGAFARGETNYADRKEGLEPSSQGRSPDTYSRGGNWNGGGWDRNDSGNGSGSSNGNWGNGQRSYGPGSGYTGSRGIVRSQSAGQPDEYAAFEGRGGLTSGYTGGLGAPPQGMGATSGYTSQRYEPGLTSGYTGGPGVQNSAPGVTSGYSGGGGGINYSMWGYGMVGGQNPQYTWMGAWPGYGMYGGYGGYYGGYGGYYGGYRNFGRGGMPIRGGGGMRGGGGRR